MNTAFLRILRANAPHARITLVAQAGLVPLFAACPDIDEVIGYDCVGGRLTRFLQLPRKAWILGSRLRAQRDYDLAILPRWDGDPYFGAYIAYFAGARRRIGYGEHVSPYKSAINRGIDRLLTDAIDDTGIKHEIERLPSLLEIFGIKADDLAPSVTLTPDDYSYSDDLLRRHGLGDRPLIAICPSGGHSELKQWPVERFAAAARELSLRAPCSFIAVGGPGEEALGRSLAQAVGADLVDTIGKTTLGQMAALLSRCVCYLGNDTGPMHVAVAVGTPVVALFGPTCAHRYRPYGAEHRVISIPMACSPCGRGTHEDRCKTCIYDRPECLWRIHPDPVVEAVEDLLRGRAIQEGPVRENARN